MPQAWRSIRIFISSTFHDMNAERNLLVGFVFPELRERCIHRKLHLIDVDLRWGVTEEQTQTKGVLEICLEEIERCRPFFVGLLGERYGWIPPSYSLSENSNLEWLESVAPGHSITALEIYSGVLRDPAMQSRAFFYFRDPSYIDRLPSEERRSYAAESPDARLKLEKLKAQVRERCQVRDYRTPDDDLARAVLEDLWTAIDAAYPDDAAPEKDEAIERSFHEAFLEDRAGHFWGRHSELEQIANYVGGTTSTPLVVTGKPGMGKSALLAGLAAQRLAEEPRRGWLLPHFVGISPESSRVTGTLRRLWREIAQRSSLQELPPEDDRSLMERFSELLAQAAAKGPFILFIDGLDQFRRVQRGSHLEWLPAELPPGVRIIVSTLKGEWLDELRARRPAPTEILLEDPTPEIRTQIVTERLSEYRKSLDQTQLAALLSKIESVSPLYLAVACEELRVFGKYENLTGRIRDFALCPWAIQPGHREAGGRSRP